VHQLADFQPAQVGQLCRALRSGSHGRPRRGRRHGQRSQQALHAVGVVGRADRDRLAVGHVPRRLTVVGQQRHDGLATLACMQVLQPHPIAGVRRRGHHADHGIGALDAIGNGRQPYFAAGDVAAVQPAGVAGTLQCGDQAVGEVAVVTRVADEDYRVARAGLALDRWREIWRGCGCGCCGEVGAGETASVQFFDQRPEGGLLFVSRSAADRLQQKREAMPRTNTAAIQQAAHAGDHEILGGAALRNVVIHVAMLGMKSERQPGVATIFAHERSEQIGGSVDDVHSQVFLVCSPGSKGDMDSRQAMEIRFG